MGEDKNKPSRGRPKGSRDKVPRKRMATPNNPTGKGTPMSPSGVEAWLPADEREKRAYISRALTEINEAYHMPRCTSDDDLADRMSEYFFRCADQGIRPTVEEMALYCGFKSTEELYDWETGHTRGFSLETADIIKKAKSFIKTFDAKLVVDGKMNPVVYFFRARNYYGMRDQVDVVVANASPLGPAPDVKRLAGDYMKRLPDAPRGPEIRLPAEYVDVVETIEAAAEEVEEGPATMEET